MGFPAVRFRPAHWRQQRLPTDEQSSADLMHFRRPSLTVRDQLGCVTTRGGSAARIFEPAFGSTTKSGPEPVAPLSFRVGGDRENEQHVLSADCASSTSGGAWKIVLKT
jgi:hypothetical protein